MQIKHSVKQQKTKKETLEMEDHYVIKEVDEQSSSS